MTFYIHTAHTPPTRQVSRPSSRWTRQTGANLRVHVIHPANQRVHSVALDVMVATGLAKHLANLIDHSDVTDATSLVKHPANLIDHSDVTDATGLAKRPANLIDHSDVTDATSLVKYPAGTGHVCHGLQCPVIPCPVNRARVLTTSDEGTFQKLRMADKLLKLLI